MTDLSLSWSSSGIADIDPLFSTVDGVGAIRNAIAARFVVARGSIEWAPDEGLDLREWLGEGLEPSDLGAVESACVAEALRDERVEAARASASLASGELTIRITCATSAGPFELELAVDAVSVSILGA